MKKPIPEIYTVTQLTRLIKLTLSRNLPDKITLTGEISNYKLHRSGHLYLTIKDENAQITAVMWKSAAGKLKFQPADGMAVVATGRVDVYEPQGKYQFYLEKLEPAGVGALELAFRQLADKLRQEGLFDEAHKKAIPAFPETIAIVTSDTGAAIQDIEKTLNRRFRSVRKLLYPVAVQGDSAAGEIARAIRYLNRRRKELEGIDVIILARGGGSIEDLWAFNEELVARAVFASEIPIISGVGHESDITIADLVADQRAATPTAAAELAVPVRAEIWQDVQQIRRRLAYAMDRIYEKSMTLVVNLSTRGMFTRPLEELRHRQQYVDEQTARLGRQMIERIGKGRRKLEERRAVLQQIEPHYALAQRQAQLMQHQHLLRSTLSEYYQRQRHRLETLGVKLGALSPAEWTRQQNRWLKQLADRIGRAQENLNRNRHERFKNIRARWKGVNPRAVLQRGYSVTRVKSTGKIITAESKVRPGDLLMTELAQKKFIESEVVRSETRKEDHDG